MSNIRITPLGELIFLLSIIYRLSCQVPVKMLDEVAFWFRLGLKTLCSIVGCTWATMIKLVATFECCLGDHGFCFVATLP